MDTQTVDEEFAKLQTEFQDVAKAVQTLAEKLQAAGKSGEANATEWLADLKQVASDIDDEQTQAKVLLLAVHGLISNVAQADAQTATPEHPPLYAPGHEPQEAPQQQQPAGYYQRGPMMGGGMMGGGMGGGMMGGYFGGGFARAMEMGAGIGLGQSLISSIFR
jgi:hypothetical protein